MNKNIQLLIKIIVIYAFIISSCDRKSEQDDNNDKNILAIEYNDDVEIFNNKDFVNEISFVKLEMEEKSLFSFIDKLIIRNQNIYIFDRTGRNYVYVFDMNGRYISRIGNIGKGPGEYLRIRDFDVSLDGEIFMYERQRSYMHIYDSIGNHLRSEKVDNLRGDAFALLDNGFLFSVSKENPDETMLNYKVVRTDRNYNIQEKFFLMPDDYKDNLLSMSIIRSSNKGLTFSKPVDDIIHVFDKQGKLTKNYSIKFSNPVPPELKLDYSKLLATLDSRAFRFMYNPALVFNDYIVGNIYNTPGLNKVFFLIDSRKKKIHEISISPDSFSHRNINFPLEVMGDSVIVSYLEPAMLFFDRDSNELEDDVISHLKEGGFVLCLYKLKKDR